MRVITGIDQETCAVLRGTAHDLLDVANTILVTGECSADEWEYARVLLSHALAALQEHHSRTIHLYATSTQV